MDDDETAAATGSSAYAEGWATAQQVLVRGLTNRASTRAHFKLTPLGRDVLAALLNLPADEHDG